MRLPTGTFNTSYAKDMAIVRTPLQWGLLAALILSLCAVPFFVSGAALNIINTIAITIISLLGLQILTGYCGQIAVGHAAFMAVGAFSSAVLTGKLGVPFWISLPCSGLLAGLTGLIFGLPSARIKGFYLALATIAAQFIIMFTISHVGIFGYSKGISAPSPTLFGFEFFGDTNMYIVIMPVTLIMIFLAKSLVRGKVGRAFVAIRDNDLAASVLGINMFAYKLLAFFLACFYAGIAGSLQAHTWLWVEPAAFTLNGSIWFLGILIVGGMGSITGVIYGVLFMVGLEQMLTVVTPTLSSALSFLPVKNISALPRVVLGLIIVVFLIYESRGIHHRVELFKGFYRLYPFPY